MQQHTKLQTPMDHTGHICLRPSKPACLSKSTGGFGSEQDCSAPHQTAGISPTPALDGGQQSGINAVCWLPTPFSETQVHCSPPARSLPEWNCCCPMQNPLFCVTAESDRHSRTRSRSKTPRVSFVRSRCASGPSSQRGQ